MCSVAYPERHSPPNMTPSDVEEIYHERMMRVTGLVDRLWVFLRSTFYDLYIEGCDDTDDAHRKFFGRPEKVGGVARRNFFKLPGSSVFKFEDQRQAALAMHGSPYSIMWTDRLVHLLLNGKRDSQRRYENPAFEEWRTRYPRRLDTGEMWLGSDRGRAVTYSTPFSNSRDELYEEREGQEQIVRWIHGTGTSESWIVDLTGPEWGWNFELLYFFSELRKYRNIQSEHWKSLGRTRTLWEAEDEHDDFHHCLKGAMDVVSAVLDRYDQQAGMHGLLQINVNDYTQGADTLMANIREAIVNYTNNPASRYGSLLKVSLIA